MTDDNRDLLARLGDLLEQQREVVPLSDEEITVLRRVIGMYELAQSWGKLGKYLAFLVAFASATLGGWDAIIARFSK